MGNVDSMPVISQTKSLVQVIGGDAAGARRTQENFSRQCPVVSQTRSLVEVSMGDADSARKTQMQFVGGVSDTIDGIPVAGHVKGAIHYACNDHEGGGKAMKSASRTTGVMAGGVAGFCAGGPAGAVVGGIAGGAAMDGIITGVDTAVHKEYRPAGSVANVTALTKNPKDPGQWFDTVSTPVFDGLTGLSSGSMVKPGATGAPRVSGRVSSGRASVTTGRASSLSTGRGSLQSSRASVTTGRASSLYTGRSSYSGASIASDSSFVIEDEPTHGMGKRRGGGGNDRGTSGSKDTPASKLSPAQLEAWYDKAGKLIDEMKRDGSMPQDSKSLIKFVEKLGYEHKKTQGKSSGDHLTYELNDKKKLEGFLQKEGVLDGASIDDLPISKKLNIDSKGTNPYTVKSVIQRLLGLTSDGQKPRYK